MGAVWTCQKCRALLEPGTRSCPYCGTDQRHHAAPSPAQDAASATRFGLWVLSLNVAIFLLMVVLDPAKADRKGAFSPSSHAFLMFGWARWDLVRHCGQYWRLLASMFLHADFFHLLMNSVGLYYVTPIAAHTFGARRTIFIYFGAGLAGGVVSHLAHNSGLGASGALCGLIGAAAVYGWRRGGALGDALKRGMLLWALVILGMGLLIPRVDHAAHLGGFAGGAVLGWFGAAVRTPGGLADRVWGVLAKAAVAAALLVAVVAWAPSLLRGFERREVELFRDHARRTLDMVEARLAGDAAVRLPGEFEEGPRGAQAVAEAVRRTLGALERDPAQARAALAEARSAWREWVSGLRCDYYLGEGRP